MDRPAKEMTRSACAEDHQWHPCQHGEMFGSGVASEM